MEPPTSGTVETDPDEPGTARSDRRSRSVPPPQAPQLKAKMFIAPLLLLGGKKLGIDYEVPEVLSRVRFAFMLVMALSLSACALMYAIVNRKKKKLSENKVEVRTKDPMAGGKEKVELLTHFEHDVREIGKAFTNQLFGFGVVGAMHLYMKMNPPLLLQTVLMPLGFVEMPVVQVHLLGKDSSSSTRLKRPWFGSGEDLNTCIIKRVWFLRTTVGTQNVNKKLHKKREIDPSAFHLEPLRHGNRKSNPILSPILPKLSTDRRQPRTTQQRVTTRWLPRALPVQRKGRRRLLESSRAKWHRVSSRAPRIEKNSKSERLVTCLRRLVCVSWYLHHLLQNNSFTSLITLKLHPFPPLPTPRLLLRHMTAHFEEEEALFEP
jgi:hypothetical protein